MSEPAMFTNRKPGPGITDQDDTRGQVPVKGNLRMTRFWPGGPAAVPGDSCLGYTLAKAPLPRCPGWCEADHALPGVGVEHVIEIGCDRRDQMVVMTQRDVADYIGGWERTPPVIHVSKVDGPRELGVYGLSPQQAYGVAALVTDDELAGLILHAVELVEPALCGVTL